MRRREKGRESVEKKRHGSWQQHDCGNKSRVIDNFFFLVRGHALQLIDMQSVVSLTLSVTLVRKNTSFDRRRGF